MNFMTVLSFSNSFNTIFNFITKFSKFTKLIFCYMGEGALSGTEISKLLLSNIVCLFSLPVRVAVCKSLVSRV